MPIFSLTRLNCRDRHFIVLHHRPLQKKLRKPFALEAPSRIRICSNPLAVCTCQKPFLYISTFFRAGPWPWRPRLRRPPKRARRRPPLPPMAMDGSTPQLPRWPTAPPPQYRSSAAPTTRAGKRTRRKVGRVEHASPVLLLLLLLLLLSQGMRLLGWPPGRCFRVGIAVKCTRIPQPKAHVH